MNVKYKIHSFLKKEYPGIAFDVFYPPDGFGDYSTNIAFSLVHPVRGREGPQRASASNGAKSRNAEISAIAGEVVEKLEKEFGKEFEKVEIVKNGFINFYLSKEYLLERLKEFLKGKIEFPKVEKQKINLEFVSANPTGPLTLGNARSAAFGDILANVLEKAGHKVTREYYINDVGNQVELLAESVKRRLQQLEGEKVDPVRGKTPLASAGHAQKAGRTSNGVDFPEELYQGDYIIDLAKEAKEKKIPSQRLKEFAVEKNLDGIKKSLAEFGVKFDVWFRESSLKESDEIKSILIHLERSGLTYLKDGAVWFKGSDFGLEKDVVLVKSNGQGTYLLSDFAYAKNKLSRNFALSIYLLGADHHDDVKRLKAGIKALGLPEEKFVVLLHQLVALKKGGEVLRMAKRKGIYVSLDNLLEQIPKDVARYFFLEKSLDTHLEFDLELAKEQSSKNPVYYIQYAFARINGVFEKARNIDISKSRNLSPLNEKEELDLIRHLTRFPEVVFDLARNVEISKYPPVHHLPQYAYELANRFHKFYEKRRIIDISESRNIEISAARLALTKAVQKVLGESLSLMGLSAPKKM